MFQYLSECTSLSGMLIAHLRQVLQLVSPQSAQHCAIHCAHLSKLKNSHLSLHQLLLGFQRLHYRLFHKKHISRDDSSIPSGLGSLWQFSFHLRNLKKDKIVLPLVIRSGSSCSCYFKDLEIASLMKATFRKFSISAILFSKMEVCSQACSNILLGPCFFCCSENWEFQNFICMERSRPTTIISSQQTNVYTSKLS